VLMVVAFRFHLPFFANSLVVDVIVTPGIGFYLFLAATMLSLVISHVMLGIHRRSESLFPIHDDDLSSPLRTHEHTRQKSKTKFKCPALGQFGVVLVLIFTIAAVSYGISNQAFNFKFAGLASLFLGSHANTPYSLLDVGLDLPGDTRDPNSFGTRWVQASFFLFAIAMPFTYLGTLLILWLCPLTLKRQRYLFVVSEVVYAWSALDVFIVSVIAALLQLSQFAQFIIGGRCDTINEILQRLNLPILDGDNRCFDVIATLNEGCWILFAASVDFIIVCLLLSRLCHSALEDRIAKERSHVMARMPLLKD